MPRNSQISFTCDYCGQKSYTKPSHYARKNRHFCSMKCYSDFRRYFLPKEEHNCFGRGLPPEERKLRMVARSTLNHAIRDGRIDRLPCCVCGEKAEAHHDDYLRPLEVKWFCFKHHRQYHNQNPTLLKEVSL